MKFFVITHGRNNLIKEKHTTKTELQKLHILTRKRKNRYVPLIYAFSLKAICLETM